MMFVISLDSRVSPTAPSLQVAGTVYVFHFKYFRILNFYVLKRLPQNTHPEYPDAHLTTASVLWVCTHMGPVPSLWQELRINQKLILNKWHVRVKKYMYSNVYAKTSFQFPPLQYY